MGKAKEAGSFFFRFLLLFFFFSFLFLIMPNHLAAGGGGEERMKRKGRWIFVSLFFFSSFSSYTQIPWGTWEGWGL
jgi:hypothetical protein